MPGTTPVNPELSGRARFVERTPSSAANHDHSQALINPIQPPENPASKAWSIIERSYRASGDSFCLGA